MTINDIQVLAVSDEARTKTTTNVILKYAQTVRNLALNPALMYQRTPVEILDNIFMGDIAKNSLLNYLRAECNAPITDYDEIRTDNFNNADPGWDFKVGNNLIKVEVKSSTPPNSENRQAIINLRDIKITASHDRGRTWIQPENLEGEIHVQIYFEARPYRQGYDTHAALQAALNAIPQSLHNIINSPKYNKPLFFGWNTKEYIVNYVRTHEKNTWTWPATSRVYWKCPIREALTLPQLIEYINGH